MYDEELWNYQPIFGINLLDTSWFEGQFSHWRLLFWNCYIGQKWNYGTDFLNFEIVSLSEVVEVPAGKFDCIKIKWFQYTDSEYNTTRNGYLFISKKYGIIKLISTPTFYEIQDGFSIKQLYSKNF